MTSKFGAVTVVGLMIACSAIAHGQVGRTEITKWQYGKSGAVSLTYDDGTINQFRVAVPIMDTFGFHHHRKHSRFAVPRHVCWPSNKGDHRGNGEHSYQ